MRMPSLLAGEISDQCIGAKLEMLRLHASVSVDDVASAAGLTAQEYVDCEAGLRRATARELLAISQRLNAPLVEIFKALNG